MATPSSRRRVDGVKDDATIQHEHAVKFCHTGHDVALAIRDLARQRAVVLEAAPQPDRDPALGLVQPGAGNELEGALGVGQVAPHLECALDGVRAVAALLEVGPHDAEEPLAPRRRLRGRRRIRCWLYRRAAVDYFAVRARERGAALRWCVSEEEEER